MVYRAGKSIWKDFSRGEYRDDVESCNPESHEGSGVVVSGLYEKEGSDAPD